MPSNIPYLAAHREKKAGKEECFSAVKRASNGEALSSRELAALYSYFLPPKPRVIKSPFDWVASICDDKANYAFCKYVEIKGGITYSATTRQSNIVLSNLGKDEGIYDVKEGLAGDDVAIMPNVMEALNEAVSGGGYTDFHLSKLEILDTPSGLAYVLPWNNKGVNKDTLDAALRNLSDISIFYSEQGAFCVSGKIKGIQAYSVIMPVSLNGI